MSFTGRPTPNAEWAKDGQDVDLRQVITKDNLTTFSVDSCTRDDAGKYTLTLTNSSGNYATTCNVIILDTPGPVEQLEVLVVTKLMKL